MFYFFNYRNLPAEPSLTLGSLRAKRKMETPNMMHLLPNTSTRLTALLWTCLFLAIFTAQSLFAQGIEIVQLRVVDPNGQPLSNVPVSAGDPAEQGLTNELGFANFFTLSEGTVRFKIAPTQAFECSGCAALKDKAIEEPLSLSSEKYNSTSSVYSIGDVQLENQTRLVKVVLKDTEGAAVVGEYVNASHDRGDTFVQGKTNSAGEFIFGAEPGRWFVSSYSTDKSFSEAYKEVDVPETDPLTTQVDFVVEKTNSSIVVNIIDDQGAPYQVSSENYAGITCATDDFKRYFFSSVEAGQSQATVQVVGGSSAAPIAYNCNLHLEGAGSSKASTSIASGESKSVNVTVYNTSFELQVKFVDGSGNPVNIPADIYAFTEFESSVDHYAQSSQANSDGVYILNLIPNLAYQVSFVELFDDKMKHDGVHIASDDSKYVSSTQFKSFESTGQSPGTLSFALQKADVVFEVSVTNNGSPVAHAWVDIFSDSKAQQGPASLDEEISDGLFIGGVTDESGKVTLYGLSGLSYSVNAWLPPSDLSTSLNPTPVKVTPSAGTTSIELKAQEADLTLALTVNASESLEWSYCAAYNKEAQNYVEVKESTASLPLIATSVPYTIICEGGTKNKLFSSGGQKYSPPSGVSTDSLTLELSDAGAFYEPESFTFDASVAKEITLPDDCSRLELPAGALGTGNVTLIVGTNNEPVPFTEGVQPFNLFEIQVYDSSRNSITTLQKPATMTLCYDDQALPEGLTESELTCVGSNEQGSGLSAKGCSINTDTNKATFTIEHFSNYGLNRSASVTGTSISAPEEVEVKMVRKKKGKGKRARIRWANVSDAVSYELRVTRTTKKAQKTSTKSVKATEKSIVTKFLKLGRPGTYTFSVAAVDSVGETSEFTSGTSSLKVRKKRRK